MNVHTIHFLYLMFHFSLLEFLSVILLPVNFIFITHAFFLLTFHVSNSLRLFKPFLFRPVSAAFTHFTAHLRPFQSKFLMRFERVKSIFNQFCVYHLSHPISSTASICASKASISYFLPSKLFKRCFLLCLLCALRFLLLGLDNGLEAFPKTGL